MRLVWGRGGLSGTFIAGGRRLTASSQSNGSPATSRSSTRAVRYSSAFSPVRQSLVAKKTGQVRKWRKYPMPALTPTVNGRPLMLYRASLISAARTGSRAFSFSRYAGGREAEFEPFGACRFLSHSLRAGDRVGFSARENGRATDVDKRPAAGRFQAILGKLSAQSGAHISGAIMEQVASASG